MSTESQKLYYLKNRQKIIQKAKQYQIQNPEQVKKNKINHHNNNPIKQMLRDAKNRSKRKGLAFNLEIGDIQIPDVCPILGIKLERNLGKGYPGDSSPTLDRIIPERGYIKNNVIVISHKANTIKSNATADELMKVAIAVKKLEEQVR